MSRWYYAKDKQKYGPVTLDDLKALLRSGELRPTDMLLQEGAQKWVAASTVAELFANPVPVAAQPAPTTNTPARKKPAKVLLIAGAAAGALLLLCCTCGFIGFL